MKTRTCFPNLAFLAIAVAPAILQAQSSNREADLYEDYRGQRTEQVREPRGPVADLFQDIRGEVRYQRHNFWDGMRGLKQDVRRAFNNDTPKQQIQRDRARYEQMEREYAASRFGYRGATNQQPKTSSATPTASQPRQKANQNIPMDERFFEGQAPVVQTSPRSKPATGYSTAPQGSNSSIVRPTPPVNGVVVQPRSQQQPASTASDDDFAPIENPAPKEMADVPDSQSDPKKRLSRNGTKAPEKEAKKPDPTASKYPVATSSGQKGIVLSPFAPHEELDVTGMKTGDLAIDPGNGRIFRVP